MKTTNPRSEVNYVCKQERNLPEDERTIFVISPLSLEQQYKLDDVLGVQSEAGFAVTLGKSNQLALHMGLSDVQNFIDETTGEPVKFERDETKSKGRLPGGIRPWKLDHLEKIPKEVLDEVAGFIKDGSVLSEEERKNS